MTPSVFFGSIAVALCCYGAWRCWRVSTMRRWKKGAARIVKIEELQRFHVQAGVRVPYFVPKVEFSYEVDGREYCSDRFSVHNFALGNKGEITGILRGAKVGDTVEMFYDPAAPQRASIVVPSYDGVIVALFLGGGLLMLVLLLRFAA